MLMVGLLRGAGAGQPVALKGQGCFEKIPGQEGCRQSCRACHLRRIAPYRVSWIEVWSGRGRVAWSPWLSVCSLRCIHAPPLPPIPSTIHPFIRPWSRSIPASFIAALCGQTDCTYTHLCIACVRTRALAHTHRIWPCRTSMRRGLWTSLRSHQSSAAVLRLWRRAGSRSSQPLPRHFQRKQRSPPPPPGRGVQQGMEAQEEAAAREWCQVPSLWTRGGGKGTWRARLQQGMPAAREGEFFTFEQRGWGREDAPVALGSSLETLFGCRGPACE